jgi:hypothetical protein
MAAAGPLSHKLGSLGTQTFYTKAEYGSLLLTRRQFGACTTPLRAIRQGGAYPRTMRPYLTTTVCGPAWAVTPFGEACWPSKGE